MNKQVTSLLIGLLLSISLPATAAEGWALKNENFYFRIGGGTEVGEGLAVFK